MAHRGWLSAVVVRRGFGTSDPSPVSFDCPADLKPLANYAADDLQGALKVIVERADADPSRVLAMGASGGGAAVVALAARRPDGLRAAINVSGGFRSTRADICGDNALISAFATFGRNNTTPTLWLYAHNDALFPPELVQRLHRAYVRAGGQAELKLLFPILDKGHNLFSAYRGQRQWLPELDRFLRHTGLPTWDETAVGMAAARLNPAARPEFEQYLGATSEKAIALMPSSRHVMWIAGQTTATLARETALQRCEAWAKETCTLLLLNFETFPGR